ncbi:MULTISPECIES: zinc-binding dehydrogenase [unclassified Leptolyngbya]|uniref:zinc-binding dehydrogenase n=1 Tax=unclassified Leptolyngbya TaxID=2650499 RepID=UPI001688C1FE|nr:NADP-dependent oxidoreductase [Leptolyngbya sp. FACHB-8]MBD2154987.1 NADP-dependent oxidoreductase [Leptolyngbya sp. FACHB-16]
MKAVRIHAYGGPEVLTYEDVPLPAIAEDDVLIRVHAAAINPVDWKIREGYLQGFIDYDLPLILGWDVSGVVEAVGVNVTTFKPGDEVYSRPDIQRDGTYAEFVAVKASEVALKPKTVDHVHAAAVPLAGITAWHCLFEAAQLSPGQRVLIHAAAGGVGSYAVQFAHWKGAHVIGTASARNRDFLLELGADEVIDYQTTQFEDVVNPVDVVFDTVGGDVQERSWQVVKPGGILVSVISPPPEEKAAAHQCRSAYVFIQPRADWLTEMAQLIDQGQVKPIVETVLPLDQVVEAHKLSQSGRTRGKIVLQVRE